MKYLLTVLGNVKRKRDGGDFNGNLLADRIEKTLIVKFEFILSLLFTVVSDTKFSSQESKAIELIAAMIYLFEGEPAQLLQT